MLVYQRVNPHLVRGCSMFHDFSMSDHPDPHVTSCVRSSSELSPQRSADDPVWRASQQNIRQETMDSPGTQSNQATIQTWFSFQHFSNIFPTMACCCCSMLLWEQPRNQLGFPPARAPTKNFICSPLPKFLREPPQLVVIPAKKVASARVLGLELVRSLNHISFLSYRYLLSLLTIGG